MTKQLETFRAWVKEQGGVTKVARLLGHSTPHISRIHKGTRVPALALAARIEKASGPVTLVRPDHIEICYLPASGWVE
jgi:DNA-binding transcriptional regulator YdaS (Cro superfamily)